MTNELKEWMNARLNEQTFAINQLRELYNSTDEFAWHMDNNDKIIFIEARVKLAYDVMTGEFKLVKRGQLNVE